MMEAKKGGEIARCLGYRDLVVGENNITFSSHDDDGGGTGNVDMWHLRSLAIEPGGLLNSHGRKLGWIKLAGTYRMNNTC